MKYTSLIAFAPLLVICRVPTTWAGSFEDLLTKVPPTANAVVLVDVANTLSSPLAQKEGWGKKLELAYVDRPIFLPPEADKLVTAAALQPGADYLRLWELAVMDLADPLSMRSIARSEGGYVDTIQGLQAAWTPSDAYFVSLSERQLGVLFPAERQYVSRWTSFTKENNRVQLSEYLQNATQLRNERIQILMAIDLTDVVQPHEVAMKIEDSPLFKKVDLPQDDMVAILASLRGAMLRVAIADDVQAQLRIDFGKDITPLSSVAKELVLRVLEDLGVITEELATWKTDIKGQTILMRGALSQDGQRRVFSIVEIPTTKFSTLKDEGENAPGDTDNESLARERSLTYFRSLEVLLKDLKRDLQGNKARAAVMERYARKIDRMPILHVDPELLDFGTNVAQTLRGIALAKREGGISYGVSTAGMGGGGYSDYGTSYGYFATGDAYAGARASAADRASIKADAMASANQARVEGSKNIADAMAAIRRKMTEKYGVEF